jgi:hypothetical protein
MIGVTGSELGIDACCCMTASGACCILCDGVGEPRVRCAVVTWVQVQKGTQSAQWLCIC